MNYSAVLEEIQSLVDADPSWVRFCNVAENIVKFYIAEYGRHAPRNSSGFIGKYMLDRILSQPSGDDCLQLCRMRPPAFILMINILKQQYGLGDSQHISAEERVAITLFIFGHAAGQRLAHLFLGHSTETINRHFHAVLPILYNFATDIIRPHEDYLFGAEYHSPTNPRHECFRDCVGVIDGTHIPAVITPHEADRYRNRKGEVTQNVLAVVDFNMCFTFVAASWEGSTHDSRMLRTALENPFSNFPFPLGLKYFLVDSGFANSKGFLAPYRGRELRYHFQDFNRAATTEARQPRNREERFNYLHSSCRNIVEHTFGVWKKRFLILVRMPAYGFDDQRRIVVATMGIHNFLRKCGVRDPAFSAAERPQYNPRESNNSFHGPEDDQGPYSIDERYRWEQVRENITREICGCRRMSYA